MMEARIGVLARADDEWARRVVEIWGRGRAVLLLPQSPHSEQWSLHLDAHGEVRIGSPHGRVQFAAILSRIDRIRPADCVHVAEARREQVADELQAFWMALLQGMACPRLNPPSRHSLCGEVAALQPACAALAAGTSAAVEGIHQCVAVVGQRVLGAPDRCVSAQARALAQRAHLPMLGLDFVQAHSGWRLGAVSALPEPAPELACEAIDDHLMRCAA